MKTFFLEVQTPEKKIFSGEVASLVVKAVDGKIGVLANHAPLATQLLPGVIRYGLESGEEKKLEVSQGFLLVKNNHASLLSS